VGAAHVNSMTRPEFSVFNQKTSLAHCPSANGKSCADRHAVKEREAKAEKGPHIRELGRWSGKAGISTKRVVHGTKIDRRRAEVH